MSLDSANLTRFFVLEDAWSLLERSSAPWRFRDDDGGRFKLSRFEASPLPVDESVVDELRADEVADVLVDEVTTGTEMCWLLEAVEVEVLEVELCLGF